jgi:hypothetical protein
LRKMVCDMKEGLDNFCDDEMKLKSFHHSWAAFFLLLRKNIQLTVFRFLRLLFLFVYYCLCVFGGLFVGFLSLIC